MGKRNTKKWRKIESKGEELAEAKLDKIREIEENVEFMVDDTPPKMTSQQKKVLQKEIKKNDGYYTPQDRKFVKLVKAVEENPEKYNRRRSQKKKKKKKKKKS
eukprot:Trichotokara_eunicae@DN8110_c0_g1_i1.p1